MNTTRFPHALSALVCLVLLAAMALMACGCQDNSIPVGTPINPQLVGEGNTTFLFSVIDTEGEELFFEVHTDKTIVGEALQELGLIEGEMGDFGLYVKTVNGIFHDYNKDGKYWAFYVNGAYAPKGVDLTEIEADTTYTFKAE